MTIFSMSLILLCACRAFVAFARKRSTNAWCPAICFSRFWISASFRSRSASFAASNAV